MKLKAITKSGVSLSAGPYIAPGETVDFGDVVAKPLTEEISRNVDAGLLEVVEDEPAPPPAAAPGGRKGR